MLVLAAGRRRFVGDQLDQARLQRQTFRVVAGERRVRALALGAHVADHGDGAGVVVGAFGAPGADGGVVDGPAEDEVGRDIPSQVGNDGPGAADAFVELRRVGDFVGEGEPVAGRGLGVRAVGPELGDDAGVVRGVDAVRGVGLAGGGVDRVALVVVGAQRPIAARGGRDVNRGALAGFEAQVGQVEGDGRAGRVLDRAVTDDANDVLFELGIARPAELGRGAGVMVGPGGPRLPRA